MLEDAGIAMIPRGVLQIFGELFAWQRGCEVLRKFAQNCHVQ